MIAVEQMPKNWVQRLKVEQAGGQKEERGGGWTDTQSHELMMGETADQAKANGSKLKTSMELCANVCNKVGATKGATERVQLSLLHVNHTCSSFRQHAHTHK